MNTATQLSDSSKRMTQWLRSVGAKSWALIMRVFVKVFPRPTLADPDLNRSAKVMADLFAVFFLYSLTVYLYGFFDWADWGHASIVSNLVILLLIRYAAYSGSVTLSVVLYAFEECVYYFVSTMSYGFYEHMQATNTLLIVAVATILIGPLVGFLMTVSFGGMFWFLFWASNNKFLTPLEAWLPDGHPRAEYTFEFLIEALVTIFVFCWLSRTHIFSQLFDSLAREKVISKQQHEARNEADKANREKTRFMAAASHDLRQPVSALNLNFEAYILAHPEAKREEAITDIAASIETLNKMLDSVLTVSKLQARVVTPVISSVSINSILQRCYAANSAAAKQKHLQLRLRSTDVVCETDPDMLFRAVNNLVDNAVKYTESGGIIIGVRRRFGGHAIFVMDSGVGIPEDSFDKIFEEFIMLNDVSRKSAGSGLGLSIVKRTVHLLGMRVRTESKVGVGSTFYVQLPTHVPRSKVVLAPSPSLEMQRPGENLPLTGLVVAVIDDVVSVRNSICRILNARGLRTIDAGSWGELMPMLHEVTPDLLITDYQLEFDTSGYDVVIAARKHLSESLPCFIITGDTSPELVGKLAALNVATLYKPLSTETLLREIQKHVAARAL
ncbi:MAG: hypothetical protein CFE43_21060 [Burkholderiales bacterium PBB3]|nr:MAG: hypothetical protein CFE43_21060 [Burkholderiales bacterium PBB3]